MHYLLTEVNNLPHCLICYEPSLYAKSTILSGITKHFSTHDKLISRQREDKASLLKSKLANQQCYGEIFSSHKNAVRASFHVSNLLAKKLKPFSDGEFVKECLDILVENIYPRKA